MTTVPLSGEQFADLSATQVGLRVGARLTQLRGQAVSRVKFEAAADNSGPLLVQRAGGDGSQPPAFDAGAFQVGPGEHFWVRADRLESFWVRTASDSDVLHVTARRLP